MRVKRLEIQGFKSFKDKTVVHFDHSITGIVGPNGCGKSNIVDAFFWVMGEQSYKHIRGTGADDLIFNGSSKYSPIGMAEATLVLETDAPDTENAPAGATTQNIPVHLRSKEVSVTRRVYRSGEGEYFINGVPARLKDIQELFMDTGVGAKGYSIIEQGQIGKIVNAKPEERRLLIEEAAGIAKYKARKKESLRKMEATQANLSRLNDVIQEIERNLASLERQAQKARLYKKYKDELIDKEMTWGRRKSQVLKQKIETLQKQRDALEQELLGLRAELQVAENTIETDRIGQLTDTKLSEELQLQIQNISNELAQQKSALELSRRRQGDLESQLESMNHEKHELQESIFAEKERLGSREHDSKGAQGAFLEACEKARTLDERVRTIRQETESVRATLNLAKKEHYQGISQATDLTSLAASLTTKNESSRALAERLEQQVLALDKKATSIRLEAKKAQSSSNEITQKRETLQNERKEQSEQTQTLEQKLKLTELERDESQKRLTQIKSKLQSLEELAQTYEGFGDGPKAALDWAKSSGFDEQLRAMADAWDVTPGYEAALEGWLEGKLEHLISENPTVALQALDQIRNSKQGRAAIHILGGCAPVSVPVSVEDKYGDFSLVRSSLEASGFEVLGELSEFVQINPILNNTSQAAAAQAISHVAVVRSFKNVAEFLRSDAPRSEPPPRLAVLENWSVVNLQGDAIDPCGILRGGSTTDSTTSASVLGRKRVISELRIQAEKASSNCNETETALQNAKQALELSRARLQTLQAEIQSLDIQAAAIARDIHQINRSVKDAEYQLEQASMEMNHAREEAEFAFSERQKIEQKVSEIISRRALLESQIADQESELTMQETGLRTQESGLQDLRVNEASLRERATSIHRELEAGRALVADRERRLLEIEKTLERATREREQHSGGDMSLEKSIETLTKSLAEHQEKLSLAKDRLEQSILKLNTILNSIKELHGLGDQKNGESSQLALETEKISGELTYLIQNLEEKYGPGCMDRPISSPIQEEMPAPIVTTEMTAEEEQILGEEVERIRERIRRLGEVNTMAIEEYEEVKKRYDYLTSEKDDLERSIQNLQEAIEHINKTSEERFKKAFGAIADRFERLFPIIFGGGQARLSLLYHEGSNDILEAGVDILAQPPGKKIANITLLSGGEKALTAVSLIFAIFLVKPSPFCLLDEVDAPLDDANIGKFNALLREMSAKSQFILITHNKKTMELNDTLYGVTMEEPGVSKIISIEMQ